MSHKVAELAEVSAYYDANATRFSELRTDRHSFLSAFIKGSPGMQRSLLDAARSGQRQAPIRRFAEKHPVDVIAAHYDRNRKMFSDVGVTKDEFLHAFTEGGPENAARMLRDATGADQERAQRWERNATLPPDQRLLEEFKAGLGDLADKFGDLIQAKGMSRQEFLEIVLDLVRGDTPSVV